MAVVRAAGLFVPRIDRAPPASNGGIVVAGELSRASGLGEAARLLIRAAESMGVRVWTLDISSLLPAHSQDLEVPAGCAGPVPEHAALVMCVNAPWLPVVLAKLPRRLVRGRRVIGSWVWELEKLPSSWRVGARFAHEAWAPSPFVAQAMETLLPGRVRAVPYPLGATPTVLSRLGRPDFGLPDQAIIVLCSFNLASSFERKNPLGAIEAFRSAFGSRPDRLLVLKVGNISHAPTDFGRIKDAIGEAGNIRLETRTFPREDSVALLAAADIVLSLHRSEGFGLVPAEAMLLGRPVVATGWSGNLSFMDEENAALVPYRLVPTEDPRAVYDVPGARWAEPDIGAAADRLRQLADDPELRARLGARAAETTRERLGAEPLRRALCAIGAPVGS